MRGRLAGRCWDPDAQARGPGSGGRRPAVPGGLCQTCLPLLEIFFAACPVTRPRDTDRPDWPRRLLRCFRSREERTAAPSEQPEEVMQSTLVREIEHVEAHVQARLSGRIRDFRLSLRD